MPATRLILFPLWLLAGLFALAACAGGSEGELRLESGVIPMPPAGAPMAAGYFTLHNETGSDWALESARVDGFKLTEVHRTRLENGMLRMRRAESVRIEAGEQLRFEPGGLHLMLMTPTQPLQAGELRLARLALRNAQGETRELELPLAVRPREAMAAPDEMHHH